MLARHLFVVSALAVTSCAPPEMRRLLYPPDFIYVERREINTMMWRFANEVALLNRALNPVDGVSIDLATAARALHALDDAAMRLPIATSTNHPMLSDRADKFRRDIRLALSSVEAEVPDVGLARSVTGACLYCHGSREP